MEKIYTGKTKDVYQLENGNVLLIFKDDVTGQNGVFDPGANEVGLSIEGMGNYNIKVTEYFFNRLKENGIETHFVSMDESKNAMEVKKCKPFGKGLEVIYRNNAYGSFIRRYGLYAKEMDPLKDYVEITLKDDDRQDPLITEDALVALNIMTHDEYEDLVQETIKISRMITKILAEKDIALIDIKLEFGVDQTGKVLLIDEIAGGNMRAFKNGVQLDPIELSKLILA